MKMKMKMIWCSSCSASFGRRRLWNAPLSLPALRLRLPYNPLWKSHAHVQCCADHTTRKNWAAYHLRWNRAKLAFRESHRGPRDGTGGRCTTAIWLRYTSRSGLVLALCLNEGPYTYQRRSREKLRDRICDDCGGHGWFYNSGHSIPFLLYKIQIVQQLFFFIVECWPKMLLSFLSSNLVNWLAVVCAVNWHCGGLDRLHWPSWCCRFESELFIGCSAPWRPPWCPLVGLGVQDPDHCRTQGPGAGPTGATVATRGACLVDPSFSAEQRAAEPKGLGAQCSCCHPPPSTTTPTCETRIPVKGHFSPGHTRRVRVCVFTWRLILHKCISMGVTTPRIGICRCATDAACFGNCKKKRERRRDFGVARAWRLLQSEVRDQEGWPCGILLLSKGTASNIDAQNIFDWHTIGLMMDTNLFFILSRALLLQVLSHSTSHSAMSVVRPVVRGMTRHSSFHFFVPTWSLFCWIASFGHKHHLAHTCICPLHP